ncbi:hypothetical protein EO98_03020 [Methanosarcina sp. 2.H.T.1A.6]|uniref:hypothetical protein n=1 Tax=unclassified Methanosarcina TaxID=2644672 RepID=UPI0006228606|nr:MULTISPECIES: hypothetical protein [unclassified Methanosarcina]KKG12881.1 hypothetical protein EO97_02275 [Methanosarcina sp. 2.H.T.1A.15]KKG16900.1 hypothetical protein EO94_03365 [Methanosarcina sp. 2.H.T.1A.3]KKG20435.1 hypothetical protein EO96_06520 [Methanosarcina sp. 2.H.T.1A.8]KKG22520.1 hypothetical protein EO98_03020 [Methanosarcina sp. 2.H.T.1A.6]
MTAGLFNATLSEELLNQVSEAVASASMSDIIFDLFLYALMVGLAIQIFRETSKIYSFMEYEGLRYFKNTFFFYGLANFFLLVLDLVFLLAKSSTASSLYILAFSMIPLFILAGVCFWFAKVNLLSSISWKMVEGTLGDRFYKFLYFMFLMFLTLMDTLVYILISVIVGDYYAFGYKAFIFVFILLLIRSNMRSGGETKPITHPYYLGLILLFTLSFLGNISTLLEGKSAEMISSAFDLLTLLAYVIILKGIRKWSRILLK